MSETSDDFDIDPEGDASQLLQHMSASSVKTFEERIEGLAKERKGLGKGAALDTEAMNTTIDTSVYEVQLKQQAAVLIEQRKHDIEDYHESLHAALAEVRRVRMAEEARLAGQVAAATEAFGQQLRGLQQQFLEQVDVLQQETLALIMQQRKDCEMAVAQRMGVISSQLSPSAGSCCSSRPTTATYQPMSAAASPHSRPATATFHSPQPGSPAHVRSPNVFAKVRSAAADANRTPPCKCGHRSIRFGSAPHSPHSSRYGGSCAHTALSNRCSRILGFDKATPPAALHKAEPRALELLASSDEDE